MGGMYSCLRGGHATLENESPPAAERTASDPETEGPDPSATPSSHLTLSKTVYSLPLVDLAGAIIDPGILATPCRLRLLDVASLLDKDVLHIVEYHIPSLDYPLADISQTPLPSYAAISYPWRDLQLEADCVVPSFSVAGAEHADSISIDIIRTACVAARAYGYEMLWLDRLCMLQNSKQDKAWQIRRMFRIYTYSSLCLIFPGGLVRLARLDDSTSWIYRAWTLQEAVAPGMKKLRLVFQLTHPSLDAFIEHRCDVESWSEQTRENVFSGPRHAQFVDKVLEEGRSATCDMKLLLQSLDTLHTRISFHAPEIAQDHTKYPVRILPPAEAKLLSTVVNNRGWPLWIAAYTRSSSRPVDMVFSLMDLLGVQVDVAQFGKDDRMKATIAMIQALMRRPSATATWLFIAPTMAPSRELSTLPEMPETSESGRAYIQTSRGRVLASEAMGTGGREVWKPAGAPSGEMTNSGYFVFSAKGALLVVDASTQGSSTSTGPRIENDSETWAVVVGRSIEMDHSVDWEIQRDVMSKTGNPRTFAALTLMLIEKHGHDENGHELYHRVGMEREIDEVKTAEWSWVHRQFYVGGPGRGERRRFGVSNPGPIYRVEEVGQGGTIIG
ncbi:hypothetical protein BOTBODRAFT_396733 [Botryobasidium botryosum FD-172 SS1]|uniref:Heterokaryon incompatibility domain-containing protein n=1 Tax=Botryobasidium botryosum (strain FD-172 SS1) TaxID=930990 RepID=A0A067MC53_BOTB1|nr:hypothetical protein BOTBODRAFT_396733 [Botryobasidium botryosum FD-172 SS1]